MSIYKYLLVVFYMVSCSIFMMNCSENGVQPVTQNNDMVRDSGDQVEKTKGGWIEIKNVDNISGQPYAVDLGCSPVEDCFWYIDKSDGFIREIRYTPYYTDNFSHNQARKVYNMPNVQDYRRVDIDKDRMIWFTTIMEPKGPAGKGGDYGLHRRELYSNFSYRHAVGNFEDVGCGAGKSNSDYWNNKGVVTIQNGVKQVKMVSGEYRLTTIADFSSFGYGYSIDIQHSYSLDGTIWAIIGGFPRERGICFNYKDTNPSWPVHLEWIRSGNEYCQDISVQPSQSAHPALWKIGEIVSQTWGGYIYYFNHTFGLWSKVGGLATRVSVDRRGHPFIVNGEGKMFMLGN